MNSYLAGTLVRVATYKGTTLSPAGGFRNSTGALADPLIVSLVYRTSDTGPLITAVYPAQPLVRDSAGLYYADLDTTGSPDSVWTYEWAGFGLLQAVAANAFVVRASLR